MAELKLDIDRSPELWDLEGQVLYLEETIQDIVGPAVLRDMDGMFTNMGVVGGHCSVCPRIDVKVFEETKLHICITALTIACLSIYYNREMQDQLDMCWVYGLVKPRAFPPPIYRCNACTYIHTRHTYT